MFIPPGDEARRGIENEVHKGKFTAIPPVDSVALGREKVVQSGKFGEFIAASIRFGNEKEVTRGKPNWNPGILGPRFAPAVNAVIEANVLVNCELVNKGSEPLTPPIVTKFGITKLVQDDAVPTAKVVDIVVTSGNEIVVANGRVS